MIMTKVRTTLTALVLTAAGLAASQTPAGAIPFDCKRVVAADLTLWSSSTGYDGIATLHYGDILVTVSSANGRYAGYVHWSPTQSYGMSGWFSTDGRWTNPTAC
ncbi:hypothetical protein [Actinosynnema sp. NPDC020468]|uniref:hypothetical protein n=1 Tax=Actinosynnema sp. NPDC020468 TaxID=3154488 RepID=UPI0033C64FB8